MSHWFHDFKESGIPDAVTAIGTAAAALIAALSAFLSYLAAREAHRAVDVQEKYGQSQTVSALWKEYSSKEMYEAIDTLNRWGFRPGESTDETTREERVHAAARYLYHFFKRVHVLWKSQFLDDKYLAEFLKSSGFFVLNKTALQVITLSYIDSNESLFHDLSADPKVPRTDWVVDLNDFAASLGAVKPSLDNPLAPGYKELVWKLSEGGGTTSNPTADAASPSPPGLFEPP